MLGAAMLQWGRARASAEIVSEIVSKTERTIASMGPRSCERGNAPGARWARWNGRSFNGAALVRARKFAQSRPGCLPEHGFNGAALVRARKWDGKGARVSFVAWLQWGRARASAEITSENFNDIYHSELQWGRARASAEIRPRRGGASSEGRASMGPRSCERGNSLSPHSYPLKLIASMGPRSCERGNTSPVACAKKASNASMGPRSCERGNDTRLRASRQALDLLQWGRARASAEI